MNQKEAIMIYLVLAIGMLVCAVLAIRADRLLVSTLWLAGASALTALILYLIGAQMIAVIELSLSVGLITILLVFAISVTGANSPDQPRSRLSDMLLVLALPLLVISLTVPALAQPTTPTETASFAATFWDERQADVFAQIVLIFSGVLGILGLLAAPRTHSTRLSAAHDKSSFRRMAKKSSEQQPEIK